MSEPRAPIHSSRENDPDAIPLIDAFVMKLAEDVDLLQDVHSEDDLGALAELASVLVRRGEKAGYPDIVTASETLLRACTDKKPDAAEAAIVELTEISLCIRQGHRGAA